MGASNDCAIAVLCVGNRLMLDDGIGPFVFDQLQAYDMLDSVELIDVGTMSMSLLPLVRDFDVIITVDAVSGTGGKTGDIFRYGPRDIEGRLTTMQSLHELRLTDLFDAALLLGYEAQGICYGMQVENASPSQLVVGLTPLVRAQAGKLVDCVLAELTRYGKRIVHRPTGSLVASGFHHVVDSDW